MKFTMTVIAAAALLGLGACATSPEASAPAAPVAAVPAAPAVPAVPAGPSPAVLAAGEATFTTSCSGCHSGSGRAPGKDVLATKAHADIVTALTTGKMARQGANLSADQKAAVASFLTGKAA